MSDLINKMPTIFEPKRKNRWLFRFPAELGIQEWWLASGSRPSLSQNATEIPFLNTSTYVIGRFIWNPIDLVLRDPIGPSATQAIMEWVRLHSESITGRQGYAAGYKKNVDIEMLDPTGVVVEKWQLQGTMATNVNFGSLSMEDDGIADITVTLQPDRCISIF